jgi:hypothetical protein
MKEWVMPAPAPWANTKQALALRGFISSPDTGPDASTSIRIASILADHPELHTTLLTLAIGIAPRTGHEDKVKAWEHQIHPPHMKDAAGKSMKSGRRASRIKLTQTESVPKFPLVSRRSRAPKGYRDAQPSIGLRSNNACPKNPTTGF